MFAVGKHGKKEDLPDELREKEEKSDHKKVNEFVMRDVFVK